MADNFQDSENSGSSPELVKRPMAGSAFVAIRTGGNGKTTVTQILAYLLWLENMRFDLVSLDVSEKGNSSKLKKVLSQTEDMVFGASMKDIAEDPMSALQNFDDLGQRLARGGAVFDFGANVAPVVFGWASVAELRNIVGDIPKITLVIPVIAHSQSIDDAMAMIKDARENRKDLPVSKIIIVYNERDGKFGDDLDGYAKLKSMVAGRPDGIEMASVNLPRLLSEIWARVQARNIPFADVMRLNAAELEQVLDLPLMQCGRGKKFFRDWLNTAVDDFRKTGIAA